MVVPYDPKWPEMFKFEANRVIATLGENVVAVHHIGSTAIPRIHAKPIIDLLIEVKDLAQVDEQATEMEGLGYEAMGEFGISDRRFFCKTNEAGLRAHHLHAFVADSEEVKRHLAFRDYMIAHPENAQRYSELKQRLAKKYPTNINGYMNGKDSFIRVIDEQAAQWQSLRTASASDRILG